MKISQTTPLLQGKNLKIAIVVARYNDLYGNILLQNTKETLLKNDVQAKNIKVVYVPGALETPLAAQHLAEHEHPDAIIALGIVIKGATAHFELVCNQSYSGLMQVSLQTKTPVIFGILTVMNEKQAKDRIDKNKLNKGKEYAQAAIEMAMLTKKD